MIKYPSNYYEPMELRGKYQTQCQHCEWVSDFIAPYPDECDIYECPECESDDIIDVNLEELE
jgi:Zn finger protein HypA/HybF involved in hydrogenase expression